MASTLSTLYVDVVQRGLTEVMNGLRSVTGQADRGTQSIRQMRDALQQAGRASQGMGVGGGGVRGGGGANPLGALANVAAPAALGAAAIGAVKAADPGVFDQLGVIMHDLAGTVGQVLAPAFRAALPVIRQVANVVAGIADAFKPVVNAIVSSLIPVVNQLVGVWGGVVGQIASAVLPVVEQLGKLLAPLATLFVSLYQAVAPLALVVLKMQMNMVSVAVGILSGVLPVIQVFAEVLGGLATVFGEVLGLVADAFGALLGVVGELLSPVMELVTLLAGALVQGIRMAVAGFKMIIDTVRGVFGLGRKPIGEGNSVGRGMINDTGTEDANSTFQRIQQAILKAGVPAEKGPEEEAVDELKEIKLRVQELIMVSQGIIAAVNGVKDKPRDLVEGAKLGAGAVGGMVGSVLGGLFGRQ